MLFDVWVIEVTEEKDASIGISGLDGCVEVQSQSPRDGAGGGCAFICGEAVDVDDDVAVHDALGSGSLCYPGGTVTPGRLLTSDRW
ncbi:hypothetical protein HPB52_011660 [Rhipicephalus sanguineus]|uniref:Uncharacterized protein n=1 Tax=Rhipicephalus sanguineus TaxID=34632 RepID=A0A9D4T9P7_RHISA|nr:hypothetical protein HPB52_011660 [Rhipicephalus sanguineus]